MTEPRIPQRIREGLNVESGLNDGICVPLLFAAVARGRREVGDLGGPQRRDPPARGDRLGVVGGVAAGLPSRRSSSSRPRHLIAPLATGHPGRRRRARLRHGQRARGVGLHRGFVGGMAFRRALGRDPEDLNRFSEQVGDVLNGVTLVLFGAILLGPALASRPGSSRCTQPSALRWCGCSRSRSRCCVSCQGADRSASSLVRPSRAGLDRVRGDRDRGVPTFPHEDLIAVAIYLTVGLSVFPTASPRPPSPAATPAGTNGTPRDKAPPMERRPGPRRREPAGPSERRRHARRRGLLVHGDAPGCGEHRGPVGSAAIRAARENRRDPASPSTRRLSCATPDQRRSPSSIGRRGASRGRSLVAAASRLGRPSTRALLLGRDPDDASATETAHPATRRDADLRRGVYEPGAGRRCGARRARAGLRAAGPRTSPQHGPSRPAAPASRRHRRARRR